MDDDASEVRLKRGGTASSYVVFLVVVAVVVTSIVISTGDNTPDDASMPSAPTTTTAEAPDPAPTTTERPVLAADGTRVEVNHGLDGVPLQGPTSLEIVVGRTVIDVDEERSRSLGEPSDDPSEDPAGVRTLRVGSDVVIVRHFWCDECEHVDVRVFVLRSGESVSQEIFSGLGVDVAPAPQGLWITRRGDDDQCTIEQIDLYGRQSHRPRQIDCDMNVVAETEPLGLIAGSQFDPEGVPIRTSYVLGPNDLQERFHTRQIVATSGEWMLVNEGQGVFALRALDGTHVRLPTPAAIGEPGTGAVSADGRYIAVPFVGHHEDMWVLDLLKAEWTQVPSFPVRGVSRALALDWSMDGRLVLVRPSLDASAAPAEVVLATWRPGDAELRARYIDNPARQRPGNLIVRDP